MSKISPKSVEEKLKIVNLYLEKGDTHPKSKMDIRRPSPTNN